MGESGWVMSVDFFVLVLVLLIVFEEDEEVDGGLGSRGLDLVCIGVGERMLRLLVGRVDVVGCGGWLEDILWGWLWNCGSDEVWSWEMWVVDDGNGCGGFGGDDGVIC